MENSQVRTFNNPKFLDVDTTWSEVTTASTFTNYLHRLTSLAQSRFRWTGLPVHLTSRLMERGLFRYGQIVFYQHRKQYNDYLTELPNNTDDRPVINYMDDEVYNGRYFALPYTYGSLDIYGDPVNLRAYGLNGYSHELISGVDSVIVRNNPLGTNTYDTIIMFAARLTAALRTQDMNIHQQRKMGIYLCDESQRTTLRNIMRQNDKYEPWILGVKNSLDIDNAVKYINNEVPYIADKLTAYKNDLWNEILAFFGIAMQNEKKERLVTDEVDSNNHFANANINIMLESRRQAMWEIKDRFPDCGEIDVHVNDLQDGVYKLMEMEEEGENV